LQSIIRLVLMAIQATGLQWKNREMPNGTVSQAALIKPHGSACNKA
jgi:hypothetical protein